MARAVIGNQIGESALGVPLAESIPMSAGDRSGPVTVQDERAWLLEIVARLEPGVADVMRLRLEGSSFQETADRLGIESARKRHLRGAHALRRRVERRAD